MCQLHRTSPRRHLTAIADGSILVRGNAKHSPPSVTPFRKLSPELGYGHDRAMDRMTKRVTARSFGRFRWHVADHPEFVPKGWPAPSPGTEK